MRTRSQIPLVLLVQPDGDTRDMYTEFLRLHGYSVFACADADHAVDVAPDADVIVTGILLRGSIDGLEWVRRLRADQRTANTPVIVLTTCARADDRRHAVDAGCDVFLPIPCLPEMLQDAVRRMLPDRVRGKPGSADLSPLAKRSRKTRAN